MLLSVMMETKVRLVHVLQVRENVGKVALEPAGELDDTKRLIL